MGVVGLTAVDSWEGYVISEWCSHIVDFSCFRSGLGEEYPLVCHYFFLYTQKLMSSISSAIIQHIMLHDSVTASMAYFYFDFRDVDKKNPGNLLRSLLMQLSSQSEHCVNILSRLHSNYKFSKGQPSERALVKCLKDMLMALSSSQFPTYIILDALDECPNTSGIPTPRDHLLGLVKDLVDLHLPNLHICVTSRLEPDIRTALKPLASGHLSLHDQPGQKRDIAKYVISVVQSDIKMKNWREDDRKLVIQSVSEKADGM
jgi:hypothetical protein